MPDFLTALICVYALLVTLYAMVVTVVLGSTMRLAEGLLADLRAQNTRDAMGVDR